MEDLTRRVRDIRDRCRSDTTEYDRDQAYDDLLVLLDWVDAVQDRARTLLGNIRRYLQREEDMETTDEG